MTMAELTFEHLGLTPHVKDQLTDADLQGLTLARVTESQKDLVKVATERGGEVVEWWAEPAGRLRHAATSAADLPVIGDWVLARTGGPHDRAVIERVLARRTSIARAAPDRRGAAQLLASNVDQVLIVTSLNKDFNLRRLERYLMMTWDGGAVPVIVLTKRDVVAEAEVTARMAEVAQVARGGVAALAVSATTNQGMDELRALLAPGQTLALVGSSGVGKSTLLNALAGTSLQPTQAIRETDDRGRHTTTARSLFRLPSGLIVIDTPGIRELAPLGDEESLKLTFDDVDALATQCRFSDCRHDGEPDCAVAAAIAAETLAPERLASFRKLQRAQAFLERRQNKSAAAAEKRKWKQIHKDQRQFKKPRF
jgi:ribosome biogenesis GTPase